ncbi:MAG: SDR family oxidoreductase [Deltaproteobacteria bacterium]|nr:SDR family oxidoreductase [Deltaproteobacteria bacterium]
MRGQWACILGASSGFGKACSLELAHCGVSILGVHFDRKSAQPQIDDQIKTIQNLGVEAHFFNVNAADSDKRLETVASIKKILGPHKVRIFLHSLAFGTLKRYFDYNPQDSLTQTQMNMTLDVMAHSLVYWTQDLWRENLLGAGSKVFAMTSAGGERVWSSYGAVSAAKAALESHIRQIALELAPHCISANALRAGVTDTPALRKIPGHEEMIAHCQKVNPSKRLTTPEDVAKNLVVLSLQDNHWLTGNVIGIDGGENMVG